ncbi:AAA family ATPase [Sphingomonas histidinilytica]|jgi:capsular exopolysaccharide synthesis family protein|uniref:non-specific protein-tyrosine kinase n=1 Tax=Rhizorhabdus histidinilytica TaxID=439228 RepID=A0A1T5CL77_9SPHN|nr:polysaccharide biosynthesis tyrosine autokinase [Rhizorhabdus histidinilytica]MBO9378344.1 AAA family ATPase [Rhizorhabdus histidinilytica]QEH78915.1 polysaccharide biosynthesis tyrosine autokinase [Sphingomonas sp. C8-2]SKB60091.1 capsular exopolysaccharide family [Rhizorhabdus histidinilytica]
MDHVQEFPTADARPEGGRLKGLLPDPGYLWMIFRRHLWLFLGVAFLILAAVALRTVMMVPIYTSTASVVIEPRTNDVIEVQSVVPNLPKDSDVVDTEVRMITSPTLAMRVATDLSRQGYDVGPIRTEAELAHTAALLLRKVAVARSGLTYVIDITASSDRSDMAAAIANTFARQYVAAQTDAKVGATRSANVWLNRRMTELRAAAGAADAALQNYKIRNGLMSAQGATMAEQEVSSLNQQISLARADLAEKQGRFNAARAQLQRGGKGADVGAALGSGTVASLRAREAEASQQLAQLETRYGELYPEVKTAKSQLADIRAQIQQEIDRILSSLEADVRVASSRLASLQGSQSQAKGSLASNSAAQVGYLELERRAEASKQIYEAFLNRSKETAAQEGLQQPDARISALGAVPLLPDSPNIKLAILFGIVGALLGGLVAVALAEYFQRGVQTKADVERRLRVRYAGAVPSLGSTLGGLRETETPQDYIISHPFSSFAESLRSLRAFVALRSRARTLAITSPLPQEGKTTTSVCLARTAALAGTSTVLVDCDLRRRGSSEMLGIRPRVGLIEVLSGEARLDDALVIDEATGLHILGTPEAQPSAYDPLTPANLDKLLRQLRERFEFVVVDTAPILGVADARAVASSVDSVLVITRWRKTSINAAEAAIELLVDANANIAGLALTQVDIRRYASTGQSDVYGYHKKFKGYYQN